MYEPELRSHYDELVKQQHASRLGLWVFLASEFLFFAALFTLYAAYRTEYPEAFAEGVGHDAFWLGTTNTAILLVGSTLAAVAVHVCREGESRLAALLLSITAFLGVVFLVLKSVEYGMHFADGIHPSGAGRFFAEPHARGIAIFFTLYFGMTGLHGLHVLVGIVFLGWTGWWLVRERAGAGGAHRVELAALYWHLVDLIWIFLWPMFYLMGHHVRFHRLRPRRTGRPGSRSFRSGTGPRERTGRPPCAAPRSASRLPWCCRPVRPRRPSAA